MKIDLAVIGQGAISPAGVGVSALLQQQPVSILTASVAEPDQGWPVFRIDQKNPALTRWQKEPRLRRASPITLYLVEAAEQALSQVPREDRAETGLIVTFCVGCLAYSRRFFEGIVTQGQRTASPALFPETVFNSPVSHVATVLGLNGAAYAVVGDETAWVGAIKTASVWLRQKRVKQVLVLGAEEFDPIVLDAYRSARWLSRQSSERDFRPSEGAGGILLRQAEIEDRLIIRHAQDGFIYRSKTEAARAAEYLWHNVPSEVPCYLSAQRNWLAPLEAKYTNKRPQAATKNLPYLGEAFTASASWNTLRALNLLGNDLRSVFLPVWGLNHQLGSLEFEIRR